MTRGVLIRCPSSKRRDDDDAVVVFRRKGRIIVVVSSIARARFSRKSARRAVAKSFLWRGIGGRLLIVRVFYLSLFSLRDGVKM